MVDPLLMPFLYLMLGYLGVRLLALAFWLPCPAPQPGYTTWRLRGWVKRSGLVPFWFPHEITIPPLL